MLVLVRFSQFWCSVGKPQLYRFEIDVCAFIHNKQVNKRDVLAGQDTRQNLARSAECRFWRALDLSAALVPGGRLRIKICSTPHHLRYQ